MQKKEDGGERTTWLRKIDFDFGFGKLESLPSMVGGVWSDDRSLQLEATTQFRKLLSIERNPPIEEVIQAGVVPRFVEFLTREDYPQLQFEAVWALTNIASGTSENTKVVIEHGAVPIFVQLLASQSDDVREQLIYVSMVGDQSSQNRCTCFNDNNDSSFDNEVCLELIPATVDLESYVMWEMVMAIKSIFIEDISSLMIFL
ncbi:unnamed protein product [Arabidopsis lyrata]|nr:unnamed protein product [Arabidopsis lyrata]